MPLPALFISHGAPDLLLHPELPAHQFLTAFAASIPRPRAIVVCSAHWRARTLSVSGDKLPDTVHDFGGFPASLYEVIYGAPGDPALAAQIADRLQSFQARVIQRGMDHGAWVPLKLLYPNADIPVVSLSLLSTDDPHAHYQIGQALKELRSDGVLVIGSGSATHNLGALDAGDPPPWVTLFDSWLENRISAGDHASLCAWKTKAPHVRNNHPSDEHYLPLLVACGAGGGAGRLLHRSFTYRVLSMAAYAWD